MAFSFDRAFTTSDDGMIIDGGVHNISGTATPIGAIAPTNPTYYYQTNGDVYFHTGSGGNNAWTPVMGQYVESVLGSFKFSSAANASTAINIAARDQLRIEIGVTGYSGNGIFSLRFGGTADSSAVDSGNNYNSRYIRAAAGSNNNFTDVPTVNTNMMRLGSQAITLGRSTSVNINNNFATVRKMAAIRTASEAGAVGTAPSIDWGQGMWANNTQQIRVVQLISTANNLSIGTTITIYGRNVL